MDKPTDRVVVAVYDPETGHIRQTVQCCRGDIEKQHAAFPGMVWLDITEQHQKPDPNEHMIEVGTNKLVPRVPPLDETRRNLLRDAGWACEQEILGGFSSSATGKALHYASATQDQTNLLHAASVGGDLSVYEAARTRDGGEGWYLLSHNADQAKVVLKDFSNMRDGARRRLEQFRAKVTAAKTRDDLAKISWR